jgi:hypothetical protein
VRTCSFHQSNTTTTASSFLSRSRSLSCSSSWMYRLMLPVDRFTWRDPSTENNVRRLLLSIVAFDVFLARCRTIDRSTDFYVGQRRLTVRVACHSSFTSSTRLFVMFRSRQTLDMFIVCRVRCMWTMLTMRFDVSIRSVRVRGLLSIDIVSSNGLASSLSRIHAAVRRVDTIWHEHEPFRDCFSRLSLDTFISAFLINDEQCRRRALLSFLVH